MEHTPYCHGYKDPYLTTLSLCPAICENPPRYKDEDQDLGNSWTLERKRADSKIIEGWTLKRKRANGEIIKRGLVFQTCSGCFGPAKTVIPSRMT
jgi:hypothetical protein